MILPSLDLLRDSVIVHLDDGQDYEVRTVTQARQLRALLDLAETELEEQQRQRELRLDKDSAWAVNRRFAGVNGEFGVLPQVYENPPRSPVVITACTCNRVLVCEAHIGNGAA